MRIGCVYSFVYTLLYIYRNRNRICFRPRTNSVNALRKKCAFSIQKQARCMPLLLAGGQYIRAPRGIINQLLRRNTRSPRPRDPNFSRNLHNTRVDRVLFSTSLRAMSNWYPKLQRQTNKRFESSTPDSLAPSSSCSQAPHSAQTNSAAHRPHHHHCRLHRASSPADPAPTAVHRMKTVGTQDT